MKQTTTQSATATGAAGSALIVLQYALSTFFHLSIPVDVATAGIMLLSPVVHMLMTHGTSSADNPNNNNPGV